MTTHSCACMRSTVQQGPFGGGAWIKVAFNDPAMLVNFTWDSANNELVAQVAGFYLVNFNFAWDSQVPSTYIGIQGGVWHQYRGAGGFVDPQTHQFGGFVDLGISDTLSVWVQHNSTESANIIANPYEPHFTVTQLAAH